MAWPSVDCVDAVLLGGVPCYISRYRERTTVTEDSNDALRSGAQPDRR